MEAVDELGYEPDLLAQSLRRRATNTDRLRGGGHLEPAVGRGRPRRRAVAARQAGYSMLLTNSENDPERDARHARLLLQRRVDGLLLSLAAEDDHRDDPRRCENADVPIVLDRSGAAGERARERRPVGPSRRDARGGQPSARRSGTDVSRLVLGQPLRFSRERRRRPRGRVPRALGSARDLLGSPRAQLGSEHGRNATAALLDDSGPTDRAHRRRQPAPRRRARRADPPRDRDR